MPVRFTSPSLGGQRQVRLSQGDVEIGLSYRRLTADDWFVLDKIEPSLSPGGQPNRFKIHTLDLSLLYGVSDRFSLLLTVPFSTGTNSRIHTGDGLRHETKATGIGDINLVANMWLFDPLSNGRGNIGIGLGVKAPTGRDDVEDVFGLATGPIQFTVHPGLQPGGGGWGIIAQLQAYQQIAGRLSAYMLGHYQMSPQETTDKKFTPTSTIFLSVFDVYHARAGLGYSLTPDVSASLGVRADGVPVRDVLGSDEGFRAPGYSAFVDPGISVGRGRTTLTLSVPVRFHGEFKKNVNDLTGGSPPPGDRGDLAKYLIFAGVAHRL